MAKKLETGIVITGDGKGGVRAVRANRDELDKLQKTSQQTQTRTERLSASWTTATRAATGMAGAIGLSTAGFAAMIARQASAARENAALANAIGVSTTRLQEMQYAAKSVGLESDAMGDILKDVSDKIGDAYENGGGEAVDVLENLGLSVEKLIDLRPDEQLLAIAERLNGMPKASQVNVLESLGNDATRLLPLLENNAAGLKVAAQEARDFGYALDADQNRALAEAGDNLTRVTGFAEGFANRLTIAVAPAINETVGNLGELNDLVSDPGFQQALNDVASIGAKMAQDLATGSLQILRELGTIDDRVRSMANQQFGLGDALASDVSRGNVLRTEISYLEQLANGSWFDRITGGYRSVEQVNEKLADKQSELAEVNAGLFDSFTALSTGVGAAAGASRDRADSADGEADANERLRSTLKPLLTAYDQDHAAREKLLADRKRLMAALDSEPEKAEAIRRSIASIDGQLEKLNGTQRQTKSEAQRAAEQLEKAYQSTAANLSKQIALVGESSNAAQVGYETESGALAQLTADQKSLLNERARELDMLQQRQDLIDSYVSSASLSGLFDARDQAQQMSGPQGRIAQRNVGQAISEQARQGAPQVQGLDAQYSGAFGEANRIEQERAQLQSWYAERIAMYEDFKSAEADKADEYGAVIADLERQRATQLQQIDMQTQQARLAGWSSMFGDLAGLTSAFAGEQSLVYKSLFVTQKAFAVAQALMNVPSSFSKAYDATVGIPYVGPFLAPGAGAAAAAAQVAQASSIKSVSLTGQAHEGIDDTRKGTWFLDDHERVVDKRTNADLKQYLTRANGRAANDSDGASSQPKMKVNVYVQGNATARVEERQDGETFTADVFVDMVQRGGNNVADVVEGVYGLQRGDR